MLISKKRLMSIKTEAGEYSKLRLFVTTSADLTVQKAPFGREMRYSTFDAIPHNPKSENHPYDTPDGEGAFGMMHLFLLKYLWKCRYSRPSNRSQRRPLPRHFPDGPAATCFGRSAKYLPGFSAQRLAFPCWYPWEAPP